MKTEKIYYTQPEVTEMEAIISGIQESGAKSYIELEKTIAYPEGGGQNSDIGEIVGVNGSAKFGFVRERDGIIGHQSVIGGKLSVGDTVTIKIKASHRQQTSRVHAGGHLLHEAVSLLNSNGYIEPVSGSHGKKAYLVYSSESPLDLTGLEEVLQKLIDEDHPIKMEEISHDSLAQRARFIPPNIPKNKPLRAVSIGDFPPVPCGGVHCGSTGMIGRVVLGEVTRDPESGHTRIPYRVAR